jgi:hypothetical protein
VLESLLEKNMEPAPYTVRSEANETRENAQVGHQHGVQPSTSCAAVANATFLDLLSVHVITCAATQVEMPSIGIIKQMQKKRFK